MNNLDASIKKIINVLDKIPSNYKEVTQRLPYYNMAATITDSVLQAGMNYKNVVYPRICSILELYADYKTTCDFIILFKTIPIESIIQWKNIKKQNTICELAWLLFNNSVNTEKDLSIWLMNKENSEELLKIKGVGLKTVDYLKLLSGNQAIPIDRHMYQFLEMANVMIKGYEEANIILKKTAEFLDIGERTLDRMIWDFMSQNNEVEKITQSSILS